jgi:hypothetical protein
MNVHFIAAFALFVTVLRAGEQPLTEMGEPVQLIPKPVVETRPSQKRPGFERLLDRFTISPSAGSSPTSFIVAGRVISDNTGSPVERIPIYIGVEGESPKLAAMTNIDGEFKFRLWLKEDHRDLEIQVPPNFAGYLYVGGRSTINPWGENRLADGFSRRYSLQELRKLASSSDPK